MRSAICHFFFFQFLFFFVFTPFFRAEADPLEVVSPAELGFDETHFHAMDGWISELMERRNVPGAIVCIGRGNRIAYLKMWGLRHQRPQPEAHSVDTLFDLASVTKAAATATAITMLIDSGKLSPETPVCRILPEFSGKGKERITVHHLLTHTSGLKDGYSWEGGPEAIWRRICELPCQHEPGEQFRYSCLGFVVLGKIAEQISGESLADFTRSRIYQPIGMMDTMFLPDPERRKRAAVTQFSDGMWLQGVVNDTRSRRMGGDAGNAGLFSTVHDLALFASVLLDEGEYTASDGTRQRLFSSVTFAKMCAPHPTTAGIRSLGWDKRSCTPNRGTLLSPQAVGHGGWTGISFWIDPASDLFVIVLTTRLNLDPSAPNIYSTAGKIADLAVDALRDPHDVHRIRSSISAALLPPESAADLDFFRRFQGIGLLVDLSASEDPENSTALKMHRAGIALRTVFCLNEAAAVKLEEAFRGEKGPIPTLVRLASLPKRRLLPQHFAGLDALVFDAVPAGDGNCQTVSDLGQSMLSAADLGLSFFVLDHPDPAGMTEVSGSFPKPGTESEHSFRRLPERYGMSVGELALLFNGEYRLGMPTDPKTQGALGIVPFEKTNVPLPQDAPGPILSETLPLLGDDALFRFQRELYLIYPRP